MSASLALSPLDSAAIKGNCRVQTPMTSCKSRNRLIYSVATAVLLFQENGCRRRVGLACKTRVSALQETTSCSSIYTEVSLVEEFSVYLLSLKLSFMQRTVPKTKNLNYLGYSRKYPSCCFRASQSFLISCFRSGDDRLHLRCIQPAIPSMRKPRVGMPVILETNDEWMGYDNVDFVSHARQGR